MRDSADATLKFTSGSVYTFTNVRVDDSQDLQVYYKATATATPALLTEGAGSDYTVSNLSEETGVTVTRVAGAISSPEEIILRNHPVDEQKVKLRNQTGSNPEEVEYSGLDRLVAMVQSARENLNRCLQLDIGSAASVPSIEDLAPPARATYRKSTPQTVPNSFAEDITDYTGLAFPVDPDGVKRFMVQGYIATGSGTEYVSLVWNATGNIAGRAAAPTQERIFASTDLIHFGTSGLCLVLYDCVPAVGEKFGLWAQAAVSGSSVISVDNVNTTSFLEVVEVT